MQAEKRQEVSPELAKLKYVRRNQHKFLRRSMLRKECLLEVCILEAKPSQKLQKRESGQFCRMVDKTSYKRLEMCGPWRSVLVEQIWCRQKID